MAFTGIAALMGAETVTAALVLSAVAEVGVALSVVGAVTGSKDLMKLGGVMGLVGGIGGMMASGGSGFVAGGAGGGAAGAGADFGMAAADAGADMLAGGAGGGALGAGADFGAESVGMDVAQAAATPALSEIPANVAPVAPPGIVGGNSTALQKASASLNSSGNGAQMPIGAQSPTGPAGVQDVGARFGTGNEGANYGVSAPDSSDSFLSKLSSFAEKNKTLLNNGMQLVGGALKGANDRSMFDEKVALEKQRLNQTGYGNQIANFAPSSIVTGARA